MGTVQNLILAQMVREPSDLLQAALLQSSIAIAVCDHDLIVRFFNTAIGQLIEQATCEVLDPCGALRCDEVLRLLGVDDVDAAMAAMMTNDSWHDANAPETLHVAIEPFSAGQETRGWLITARAHLKRSPSRMTERELITRSAKLTPREREVMLALADGASNKVIASRLGISPRTVEFHRAKIMHRFAANSVIDLVKKVTGEAQSHP